VLDAVASTAARLCGASDALIRRVDGGVLQRAAHHGSIPASNEARLINRDSISGRAVVERRTIHVRDVAALEEGEFPVDQALARRFGYRTVLCAPLLREGQPIGTIAMRRVAALPFSDQQIKLFQTFADQAVIAIENVRLFKELEARNRELTEALEQQTATGEILRVISGSPTDIQPVLDAVASTAARLCDASDVLILRRDGEMLRQAAQHGSLPAMAGEEVPVDRGWVTGRCVVDRRSVQVDDVAALDEAEFPIARAHQRRWGHRTALSTPLLREGRAIGAIALRRMEVRPFSERQIRLLETFADQAVIAIENVRLFNETKEALERQTATAEILRAISGSLTDVAPVFDAILESAIRLCDGDVAALWRYDGQVLRFAGAKKVSPEAEALFGQNPLELGTYNPTPQAAFERRTVHVMDVFSSAAYRPLIPAGTFNNRPAAPTVLAVPLLREGNLLGVISIWRLQKRLFSYKQVEMVNTFAAQAVIAIENVRLFNETKEALERQTATADILRVMSSSPTDVQPVFEAIVQSGVRLFENAAVAVVRPDGDQVRLMAIAERDPRRADMWRGRFPFPLSRDYMHGAAILDCTTVDVPDVLALTDRFQAGKQNFLASGYRAMTVAPMVRDGAAIGTISVIRMSPGPLSDKQLALLKTFADQAVIAIENVRLFNETKEALEQQKASAEVLQVISSSVSDAQPVFEKILESCERLFVGQHVGINLVGEDGAVRLGPYRGACRADLERIYPLPLSRASASGLAIMERRVMHYPDVEGGADVPEPVRQGGRIMGFKSAIFAPMLWEGRGIGTIWVNREFAGPFSDKEIALLKTFADQAVIAIQNARLFHEIQEKSHQLEIADQHKSAFLANMSHELRTPLNAVIGFSEMLAARYFGELTTKQAEYVNDIHGSGKHLLSLINDILDLSKIEAGRMELELADFDLRGALDNALTLVRERAQRGGVALRLETDPRLGRYRGDERKLKQVVLNLLSNAVKFTPRGGAVSVVAKLVDGSAEIVVTDTGVGIAPADQEAIFEAFRQVGTDATRKREGTGLGLALTRRFVELHGGTIRVASAPGKGSTFTVTLPIRHGE
jgi:signal transduction histidine kinase/DNA-binding GntR family transcriptional regulator